MPDRNAHSIPDCPECEGRGNYCLRANDHAWSELIADVSLCDFCNGAGRVCQPDTAEYDPQMAWPVFPYRETW
jgi:hypothetical protein